MRRLELKAPAKINLTLEVLARRRDGFHEIKSVMQTIALCDRLVIEPGTGIEYISPDRRWRPEKSLVPPAVSLLRASTATTLGATIRVSKSIPLASGLGGESSLAAAVLRGLNWFWELDLASSRLEELAARVGSDVTFFLWGGTALAQGRGEKITPLPPVPKTWVVLLVPPLPAVPEKTARLYAQLKTRHYRDGRITERLVTRLGEGGRLLPSLLFNIFDGVVPEIFPDLEAYRRRFSRVGATAVHLAGSGPALFALVGGRPRAEALHQKLKEQGLETYLVTTTTILDKSQNIL